MTKQILKSFLAISFFILIALGCVNNHYLKSEYLDSKNNSYRLFHNNDSLLLDYSINIDTTGYELAELDLSKVSVYQSAYFAWHLQYISYRLLQEQKDYNYIKVYLNSDTLLENTLYSYEFSRKNLQKEYENPRHLFFMSYLFDSIPVDEYFVFNKVMSILYNTHGDKRLMWNYVHLINQYEKNQCEKNDVDVSFEVFALLDIGIQLLISDSSLKSNLLKHNNFYISHCLPDEENLDNGFEYLNLDSK